MKHSKLPWEVLFYDDGIAEIVEVAEEESDTVACLSPDTADNLYANAEFIVTACNEYDTLKAKAELFDEAIESMRVFNETLQPAINSSTEEVTVTEAFFYGAFETLLSKAKALK